MKSTGLSLNESKNQIIIFTFRNKIYCQEHGVAMRLQLGPDLGDRFKCNFENNLIRSHSYPTVLFIYFVAKRVVAMSSNLRKLSIITARFATYIDGLAYCNIPI